MIEEDRLCGSGKGTQILFEEHFPTMKFPLLAFALCFALESPGSSAFQNGSAPKQASKAAVADRPTSIPPSPFNWPIVGTLPDFISRGGVDAMWDVHESMYKEYGPVYKMSIMGEDELIISDPRVMDQVLRKEGMFPIGGGELVTNFRDYYLENDMIYAMKSMTHNQDWKDWRSAISPDLYVLWSTYLPSIADTCREISNVAGREVHKKVHISDFLSRCSFDMFGTVLHGKSPQTTDSEKARPEDIEFVVATKKAFDITGNLLVNPLEKIIGGELFKEFKVNMDKTMSLAAERGTNSIQSAMKSKAKHEESMKEENSSDEPSASGCPVKAIQSKVVGLGRDKFVPSDFQNPSYIERLVNRGELSGDEIAELQGPFLMAGVDTTAYVMGWFYLNMASNPDVQTKLAKELHKTLQGDDLKTVEQFESLHYLKQCFRESHRLTPNVAFSAKILDRDIEVYSGLDDKSYKVPAGQRISLNLRGLPLDPKYVENPKSFIPERFSPEAIEARAGTPSELALDHPYFSDNFGRGKRRCVGANVAIAEMMCLASRLLQDWEIRLIDPNEAVQSPTKTWKAAQKLMQIADPYPAMELVPRTFD